MHNAKYILICGATAPGAREIRLQVSPAFHTTICREPQQPCFMTNFFITFLYTLFYCLFKNNHFGDFEQVIVKIVVLPILNKS